MQHEANMVTSIGTAPALEFLAYFCDTSSSVLICFKSEKNLMQLKSSAYLWFMTDLIFSNLKIQLWQLKLKQVIFFIPGFMSGVSVKHWFYTQLP